MINVGAMVASLTLDTKRFMVGMQKVTKAIGPLKTRFAILGNTVKKFARQIVNLRTAFLALGVAMAGRKIMGEFQRFQTALVDMGKVTSRSLIGIRKEVMALDTALGTSTELMQGYYQVISAGVKGTSKQLDVLTVATKASLAAHIDQSEVIKGLTAIVDAYEGKVRDAAEAADILFTIERLGKTTVAELIPIIGSLASMSATMKISQDELGGSLAQMTKFIGSTAEAATQLKALYTALLKPNAELNALFKEQGGVLKAIEKIGFIDVLEKMWKATDGNVEALKALLEGRREALLGMLSMAKGGFIPVIGLIEEMTKKTGAMNRAYKEWKNTLAAVYVIFKATLGKVMIEMGRELVPTVIRAITRMSDWLKKYQDVIVAVTKAMVVFISKMVKLLALFAGFRIIVGITLLFKGFTFAVSAATAAVLKLSAAMKANLIAVAGLVAYEVTKWLSKWTDGTAKAERGTREWAKILKILKERLDKAKKSVNSLSDATQKWLEMHEKWDKEAGEVPLLKGLTDEQIAKFKEAISEIDDYYNQATMDRFDYQKFMLDKELQAYLTFAGMKVDILRKMVADGGQIASAEKEEIILRRRAWEAYFAKLKELNKERIKDDRSTTQIIRNLYTRLFRDTENRSIEAYKKRIENIGKTNKVVYALYAKLFRDIENKSLETLAIIRHDWEVELLPPTFPEEAMEKITIEQLTVVKDMYKDMIDAGMDYGKEYKKAASELLKIDTELKFEILKNIMEETKARALANKWRESEIERMAKLERDIRLMGLSSMMSDFATFFDYMAKENKKYFMVFKAAAIATTIIETYIAAQRAYTALAAIPPLAIAAAVAAVLAGFARVASIKAQTYAVGGWLEEHPKGGKIKEGTPGKDDVFLEATPGIRHLGMRDEYVFVLNKEQTKRYGAILEAMNRGLAGGGWINRGYGGFDDIIGGTLGAMTGGWGGAEGEFKSLAEQTKELREEFRNFTDELASLVQGLADTFDEAAAIFRAGFEAAVPGGVMFAEFFEMEPIDIHIEPMLVNMEEIRRQQEEISRATGAQLERDIQIAIRSRQATYDAIAAAQEAEAIAAAIAEREVALAAASQAAMQEVFDTLIIGSAEFAMLSEDVQAAITNMVESGEEDVDALLSYWTELTGVLEDVEHDIASMMGETTKLGDKIRDTEKQFDDWINQLDYLGVAESEITALREKEAAAIAHLTAEMKKETYKRVNKQLGDFLNLFTDLDQKLISANDTFDKMIENLIDIEATAAELATVEAARATALGIIAYEMASKAYDDVNKAMAEMFDTLSPLQNEILSINDEFDSMINTLKEIHASEDDLRIVEAKRADAIKRLTDEQKKSIEEILIRKGLTPGELAIRGITQEFTELMEEIAEWATVSGEGYKGMVTEAKRIYVLEMESALSQSEAAQAIEKSIMVWKDVAESIEDVLYGLRISLASPADIFERMDITRSMIDAFGEITSPEQAQELQQLWLDYLNLAQEAYQRPSSEYQIIWDQVTGALEDIRGDAESFQSAYETQVETLAALTFGGKSAAEYLSDISADIVSGITVATDVVIPETISLADAEGNVITSIQAILDRSTVSLVKDTVNVVDSAGNVIDSFTAYLDRETVGLSRTTVDLSRTTVDLSQTTVDLSQTTVSLDTTSVPLDVIGMDGLKTVLEQIRANTYAIYGSQWTTRMPIYTAYAKYGGIFTGPESGYPVMLHGIEKVTPLGGAGREEASFVMNLTINESRTPRETGIAVRREMEGFMRSARGGKIIQERARGR